MKFIAIIVVAALAGAALWILVRRFERSRTYFPSIDLEATPAGTGFAYEDVYLVTADRLRIHGWWIPAARPRGTLLFCHGNAGNISHRLESVAVFHRLGLNVFIFDYRGYGKSEGSPDEKGTYRDAEAAYRYLRGERSTAPEQIIVFGRSLGGAVAVELARRKPVGALISEGTFTSTMEMGKLLYPLLPAGLIVRNRYDSISKVGGLTVPKLFIHSRDDEMVPFEQGERLYRAAAEPKRFLAIRGGHGDGFLISEPAYSEGIDAFLNTRL